MISRGGMEGKGTPDEDNADGLQVATGQWFNISQTMDLRLVAAATGQLINVV